MFGSGTFHGDPPSGLYEDLQWAISEALNELGGCKSDPDWNTSQGNLISVDKKSLDVQNYLEDHRRSKSLDQEVEGWKNPSSEKMPEVDDPSSFANQRIAREMVRTKLQATIQMLDFTAVKTVMQMEREEDLWKFCNLFPQHYEIDRDTIAQLWVASGFVTDDRYKKLIIDSYFDALSTEGCVKLARTSFPTGDTKYIINVDMPKNMTEGKLLYLRLSESKCLEKAHAGLKHLSLEGDAIDQTILHQVKNFKDLKTLLFLYTDGGEMQKTTKATSIVKIPFDMFSSLPHLQVLDLSGLHLVELPSSIGQAKELRYLDMSFSLIELLPETIDCLQKLQTLKLKGCAYLFKLPEGITKLSTLQHLDLNILQLSILPRGMGALTNLETLSGFIVDKDEGRGINVFRAMNNLRGAFIILRMERVSTPDEAKEAALSEKIYIKKLDLRWSEPRSKGLKEQHHEYQVLDNLRPSSSLEHLEISSYGGMKFPDWISNPSFHMLSNVTFVGCGNLNLLPSLGELPSLRVLQLIGVTKVAKMTDEFRGHAAIAFPMLEELSIVGMLSLKTWSEVKEGDFPRLCKLTIERCPKLINIQAVSCLYYVKKLEISHCPKLSSLSGQGYLPASLKTLIIDDCPSIKKRYLRRNIKLWDQIKGVQNVWIDDNEVITDSSMIPS